MYNSKHYLAGIIYTVCDIAKHTQSLVSFTESVQQVILDILNMKKQQRKKLHLMTDPHLWKLPNSKGVGRRFYL